MKFICKTAVLGWAAALLLAALSAGAGQTYAAERFIQKISPETGFEQGIKQAKDWKTAHPDGQLTVEFADGFYPLEKTWKLDPSWNGTADAPTVFRAAPGAKPILSGGRVITGWKVGEDGRWRVTLDDVKAGNWYFIQLFVNNQRRFRPRLPENGVYNIAEHLPEGDGKPDKQFRFNAEDGLRADWKNLHDVEILAFHNWEMSRNRIDSINESEKIARVLGSSSSGSPWGQYVAGLRYFIENVAEALSKPGEWYLDRATGELTYIPQEGETPENTTVIAPKLESLCDVLGEKDNFVRNIEFQGLLFAHSNWTTPERGNTSWQAEVAVDGALRLAGAEQLKFSSCGFFSLGHYGLGIGTACGNIDVENCEFKDVGAGGIRIGGALYGQDKEWPAETLDLGDLTELPEEARVVSNVRVRGCYLTYLGRVHPAGIGVWIGYAKDCSVRNCEIYDLYYSASSIGWVWGYGKSVSVNNDVSYNRMHKIGQKLLSDMGGVYTLGISPGTKVCYNMIYDVDSFSYGGWGLYTDEGSSQIEMSHNIVYNTKTGSFHQHYGEDNRIVNNILVNSREHQLQRSRIEDHNSFFFERNIVYWENDSPTLGSVWSDEHYVMDGNVYFNPNHEPTFLGQTFQEWQKNKQKDLNSVVADPGFVDVQNHNFALKPDSPALKLGFEPIDTSKIGPQNEASILSDLPEPPVAFPLPE